MLQFYDKPIILSALALAVLGTPASARVTDAPDSSDAACALSNGLGESVSNFHSEAAACLASGMSSEASLIAVEVSTLTAKMRSDLDLKPLAYRTSLDETARLHAMEMAKTGNASHTDHLGRSHMDHLRILDRTGIYGAGGANIAILPAGTSPEEAFRALSADSVNAENMARDIFTHTAVAVSEAENGDLYLVQVFAQLDGELETPAPLMLTAPVSISAQMSDAAFEQIGWRLESDGQVLRRAAGETVRRPMLGQGPAFIEIEANLGTTTYRLKGPAVDFQ